MTIVTIQTRGGDKKYHRLICGNKRCGIVFYSKRSDATTCSNRCRQALHRQRNRRGRKQHKEKSKQYGLPEPEGVDYQARFSFFETRH